MDRIVDGFSSFDVDLLDLEGTRSHLSPSSNTGGNLVTPPQIHVFDHKSSQKCKIDYLSFTSRKSVDDLSFLLSSFTRDLLVAPQSRGWQGYPLSAQLMCNGENVGLMAWGAPHGRNFVSISGAGCKVWTDYHITLVHNMLIESLARITRIDYALDFYQGEVSYDDCEAALSAGKFSLKQGGRKPSVERHGSEGHYGNKGRTLYVGAGSKRICMYEKGLEQFGKLPSVWLENQTEEDVISYRIDGSSGRVGDVSVVHWLRAEVRYGNADRELDDDNYAMLTERDKYFAGAYPFCSDIIGLTDGVRPPTMLTETEGDVEKMKLNGRSSYGGLVHSLRAVGYTDTQIADAFDSGFHSKKLVKAGLLNHLKITPREVASIPECD